MAPDCLHQLLPPVRELSRRHCAQFADFLEIGSGGKTLRISRDNRGFGRVRPLQKHLSQRFYTSLGQAVGAIIREQPQHSHAANLFQTEEEIRHLLTGRRHAARFHIGADELNDCVHGRSRLKDGRNPDLLQIRDVLIGNDSADDDHHVVHLVLLE
jgi:hypothetical protein